MRFNWLFLALFFSIFNLKAGLLDNKLSYDELFEVSKQNGKPIVLYFHNNNCGWCKKMDKTTFADEKVKNYINDNFLFYSINTDLEENNKINERFKIKVGPVFLFLDSERKIYHKFTGFKNSEDFVKVLESSKIETNTILYNKQKYDSGDREKDFLYNYCYMLQDANDLDSTTIIEYFKTLTYEELFLERNLEFLFDFVFHNQKCIIGEDSKEFKFILENWRLLSKFLSEEQAKMRLIFLVNEYKNNAFENNDSTKYFKYLNLLKENVELNKLYTIEYKNRSSGIGFWFTIDLKYQSLYFYYKHDYFDKYEKYKQQFIQEVWNNSQYLNDISYSIQQYSKNRNDLLEFLSWIERSIELDKNYYNMDSYANILFKLEDYKKALKIAKESLELAKESDVPDYATVSTKKLIEELKDKK